MRHPFRASLRAERGQTLAFAVLVLLVVLLFVGVVGEGGYLFVLKRHTQNAADAAALAAAMALRPGATCGGPDTLAGTCRYDVLQAAQQYSGWNGGPSSLHACGDSSDSDCYLIKNSDQVVQVRLTADVTSWIAQFTGLDRVHAKAAAVAGAATGTTTTPGSVGYSVSTITSPSSVSVSTSLSTSTTMTPTSTVVTTPDSTSFAYTASTACNSITLTAGSGDTFSGIWSNGGYAVSGGGYHVSNALQGSACAQPAQFSTSSATQRRNNLTTLSAASAAGATQLVLTSVTGFGAGQQILIGGTGPEFATVSSVNVGTKTITLSAPLSFAHAKGAPVSNTDWPNPLPSIPSSCTGGNATIDAIWLAAHPPGTYCWTGTITIDASFTGYEFVSRDSTASNAIKTTVNGLTFQNGTTASPRPLLYAVNGGIALTPGGGVQIVGEIYAPFGDVAFTGGNNTDTGLIESQTLTINNSGTVYNGTGTGVGGGTTSTTFFTTTTYSTSTTYVTSTTPGGVVTQTVGTTTSPPVTSTVVTATTSALNE